MFWKFSDASLFDVSCVLYGQATCQAIVCIDELRIAGLDAIHDSFFKHCLVILYREIYLGYLNIAYKRSEILYFVKAF